MIKFLLSLIFITFIFSQEPRKVVLKDFVANDSLITKQLIGKKNKIMDYNLLENNLFNQLFNDQSQSIIASEINISHIDLIKGEKLDSVVLFINYKKGVVWKNDSILVHNNKLTNANRIIRQSRLEKGNNFSELKLKNASDFLQDSPFTNELLSYDFYSDSLQNRYLQLNIDEKKTFFLNAIMAFRPETEKFDALFTSDINLKLENISGSGRALDLQWQKKDNKNDLLSVSYLEPWVLSLPIDMKYRLMKESVDSLYVNWNHDFKFIYQLSSQFKLSFQISFETLNPTDSIRISRSRIPFSNSIHNSLAIEYNNLNRFQNPLDGLSLSISISSQSKSITGPDWLLKEDSINSNQTIRSIKYNQRFYYSFTNYLTAYNKSVFSYTDSKNLFLNDYQRLGGANTVRAFLTNQFRAKNYFYNNFELRLINSERERFFIFQDYAYFSEFNTNRNKEIASYGLGFRLDNRFGIFGIDLALEYGRPFKNAIFHFTVSSKLVD